MNNRPRSLKGRTGFVASNKLFRAVKRHDSSDGTRPSLTFSKETGSSRSATTHF
jgi:hypothetical protein